MKNDVMPVMKGMKVCESGKLRVTKSTFTSQNSKSSVSSSINPKVYIRVHYRLNIKIKHQTLRSFSSRQKRKRKERHNSI
jgi:hypothetical protein